MHALSHDLVGRVLNSLFSHTKVLFGLWLKVPMEVDDDFRQKTKHVAIKTRYAL